MWLTTFMLKSLFAKIQISILALKPVKFKNSFSAFRIKKYYLLIQSANIEIH